MNSRVEFVRRWRTSDNGYSRPKKRALGAEQEAEQWRAEVEQLKETLETTRQEGEETKEALTEQLAAKTTLVENLTEVGSERQLELDNLRAQITLAHKLQCIIPCLHHGFQQAVAYLQWGLVGNVPH